MIIESVRLKNIKSYGEGFDGNGVTISFLPGANRIAGKNGHGKTTVIESIGYALFLTGPVFEESFQLETYFLRTGKKAGEIDVTFNQLGELYRIERGLGPYNKRKTKVIQLHDGSTCAEGESEVCAFICRLLGFSDGKRFSELFWKLIGVRQGRLTWPFDSKPSIAKDFFEPLLDVAVFRECFYSLKPGVDEFEARLGDQERIKAGIEERIRERSESAAGLEAKRLQVREHDQQLESLNKARNSAWETIALLEAKVMSLNAAEGLRNAAENALLLARQQRENAEERVRESTAASNLLARVIAGSQAYEKAEIALKDLRAKQTEQRRLEREIADAEKKKVEFDGKADAARLQANALASQRQEKEAEKAKLSAQLSSMRARLSGSQEEFERQKMAVECITKDLSEVRQFVNSFGMSLAHEEATLEKIKAMTADLNSWDPSVLQKASRQEATANETLQHLRQQFAAANAEHYSLAKQLEEINEGVCPFLKEKCRQFDPSKVEGDLRQKMATIAYLRKDIESAESALCGAKSECEQLSQEERNLARKRSQLEQMAADLSLAFDRLGWDAIRTAVNRLSKWIPNVQLMPDLLNPVASEGADASILERRHRQNVSYFTEINDWWRTIDGGIQARVGAFQEEDRRRNADQQNEFNGADQLRRIESEVLKLAAAENKQRDEAAIYEGRSAELLESIVGLDQRFQALAFVADEISRAEQIQLKHHSDHDQYLGAKSLADERNVREEDCNARREAEAAAHAMLRFRETALAKLKEDFDPGALPVLRREFEKISAAAAKESANLDNAKRELHREEERFREWQEACATRDEIDHEIGRLKAAIELMELARVVLRDSAPAVAQHICDRVAGRAQRIFNQINHDPVELKWEAAPRYSLRLIPGERRFAMLSGGEQTKLALAMTLAMIQEFSGLRFCIFDEPTYGIDAETREKLGEVMLEVQKAAGLEQLILVSHDDVFDGKIENSIFLRKTAAGGTEVVESFQ
jgi:DNA repair protein SbcC/Rad50